jgi:rod shape-determining protein MreD
VNPVKPILVIVVALVLHTSVMVSLSVAGVHPDLMLLVAIIAGLTAGSERGAVVGFAAGLAADFFVQTPLGLSALTYCLVAYAVGNIQGSILRSALWIAPLTALVASAAGVLLFGVIGAVVGQTQLISVQLLVASAVVAVMNAMIAPFAQPFIRWSVRSAG